MRVLNDIALMVTVYLVLTVVGAAQQNVRMVSLIPLGQHSLYTFILHVYVVLLVSQFITFDLWRHARTETLVHAAALGILWLMAKYNVAARWIPNKDGGYARNGFWRACCSPQHLPQMRHKVMKMTPCAIKRRTGTGWRIYQSMGAPVFG